MSSHGREETERLKANIQDQLNRLIAQLQDLEELRAELEDDEYEETRKDTLEQMAEFDAKLKQLLEGDMTLVSELGALKLAVQAAVADAFKTPEVIASFAKREPAALRNRLARLHEDYKLGRIPSQQTYKGQAVEVILALKKLGETLTAEEKAFLDSASDEVKRRFEAADKAIGENAVMSMAAKAAATTSSSGTR